MSILKESSNIFLFSSILYSEDLVSREKLTFLWEEKYGKSIYFWTPYCPMKEYYLKEMEGPLERFFLLSPKLYRRDEFVKAKLWAQDLEENTYSKNKKRIANIDIGALSLENLQLATGKNFTHRVYLSDNIFSDLTLIFKGNSFAKLDWSYPDYSSKEVIEFFNWARKLLQLSLIKS